MNERTPLTPGQIKTTGAKRAAERKGIVGQVSKGLKPPDFAPLTVEALGAALVCGRVKLPPMSNDGEVQKRIETILHDPSRLAGILYELAARRAHEIAICEMKREAEQVQRDEQAKSRAAGLARAKKEFASASLGTLQSFVEFALADGLGSQTDVTFAVLLDAHSRVSCNGRSATELFRTLDKVPGGTLALSLEESRLTAFVVSPDGVEGWTKFSTRFRLPKSLAWTQADGATVFLYAGVVEDSRGEHLARNILPGVTLTSAGTIVCPPQPGTVWATTPRDVEQGNASGLPPLPPELSDLLRGLRGADSNVWPRYFRAVLDNPATA